MNIKRLLAFVLAMMMVLGLCACGQSEQEPAQTQNQKPTQTQNQNPVTEAPNQDPVEVPTQEATEAPTQEANTNPVYTVKVVDEAGNPISGLNLQICQGESCMPSMTPTNAEGVVTFQVPEAEYKASILGGVLPAGYEYTTEETEFYFENYEVTIVLKVVA